MSHKRIVIIFLASAEKAAELASHFPEDDFQAVLPRNTDEFYRCVNTYCVELVVIDNHLPGFLTGVEILERLHKDLLRPTTVLIAVASSALHERVRPLELASIIKPTAGVAEIADLALSAMKAGKVAQVPISAKARRMVQDADIIRPLPQIVVKYASQLDQESCTIGELAQDISVDQKMTSVLLKLMNSAAMATRTRITRVFDAVNHLGTRKTVALILSASLAQSRISKALPDSLCLWYQNRSVLIGSTASAFARHTGESSPDTAYVLGLLQELGIPILAHTFGETYLELLRRVKSVGQLKLDVTEQQEFEINHAEVSAALLQKWELPQSLIRLVVNHHQPESALELPNAERKFLHLMRIGEAFANLSDNKTPQRHRLLNQAISDCGLSAADNWKGCLADAVSKALESSQLLSIPVPDEATLRQMIDQLSAECGDALPKEISEEVGVTMAAPPPLGEQPTLPPPESYVLVVDDEPGIPTLVSMMLKPVGIPVRTCAVAEEALPLVRGAALLLCDVHLGEMSGTELVRRLRAEGFARPIVMMSGDRSRATVEESVEAGIDDYLVKPFDRQMLLSKINKHIPILMPAS